MKQLIFFLLFLHMSLSAPVPQDEAGLASLAGGGGKVDKADNKEAGKVSYDVELDNNEGKITFNSDLNDLSYSYRMETSDGTIKHETGRFEKENLVAEGGYEYIGDNGLKYSVTYVADKDGYRPKVSFGTKSGGTVSARSPKSVETKENKITGSEKPIVIESKSAEVAKTTEKVEEPETVATEKKVEEPETAATDEKVEKVVASEKVEQPETVAPVEKIEKIAASEKDEQPKTAAIDVKVEVEVPKKVEAPKTAATEKIEEPEATTKEN